MKNMNIIIVVHNNYYYYYHYYYSHIYKQVVECQKSLPNMILLFRTNKIAKAKFESSRIENWEYKMTKARKNNKNRRAVKVKQKKPRDVQRKFFKANISHTVVRKAWDNRKTARENMKNIGAMMDPNEIQSVSNTTENSTSSGEKKPIDFMNIADIVDLSQQISAGRPNQSKRGKHHMTEDEIAYIKPLVDKYDNDEVKMSRDMKLNYKQLTRNVLRRRAQRYKELLATSTEAAK